MWSEEILKTVEMIQKENLDVRAVTMGISLLDCRRADMVGDNGSGLKDFRT